jgi:hypothetical protein
MRKGSPSTMSWVEAPVPRRWGMFWARVGLPARMPIMKVRRAVLKMEAGGIEDGGS